MTTRTRACTLAALAAATGLFLAAAPPNGGKLGSVLPAAATQNMKPESAVRAHPAEIKLWDGVPPDAVKIIADLKAANRSLDEVTAWRTEIDTITGESISFPTVTNIHFPTITPFLPAKDKATGAAMIVCPGGGHMFHTINHEGYDVAQYLADHGVAAFVLKYRLARAGAAYYPNNTYSIGVQARDDGQRSLRYVRAHAKDFNIDPDEIGMMGFSAGGEVAVQVNLNPSEGTPDAADPIDRTSCKMNFEALVYPGVSALINPTKDWPVVFLACSADDRPDIAGPVARGNSTTRPAAQGLADVYLRYKAVGVPAELHIYSTGGHGFGARDRPIEEAGWMDNLLLWMKDRGMDKK